MPLVSIFGGAIEKVRSENLDPERTFFYMPTVCIGCNWSQFPILSDLVFRSAGIRGLKIGLINMLTPGEMLPVALRIKMLQAYIAGGVIYKMYNRIVPYEVNGGETEGALLKVKKQISRAILSGENLLSALADAVRVFNGIRRDESAGRKPKIGLLGDFYVKYNEAVNQKLQTVVEKLGGELIMPSMTEFVFHFYDADIRLYGDNPKPYRLLRTIERRFEKASSEIIGDQAEPDFAECVQLMQDYKIEHYLVGETSINVGRALHYITRESVDAIIHINPIFCCPGVVTAAIYRRIQEDFHIPIIDIFYDGSGNPNKVLIPHLHYLRRKKGIKA